MTLATTALPACLQISLAGTFGTQAGYGAWLAALFKMAFPQCIARVLGPLSLHGWYSYFDIHGVKDLETTYYKTQVQ